MYDLLREDIKSGDLLAWSHRGWKSWYDFKIQMVRVFTRSEFSHVGIAWVYAGRVFVIESVIPVIRIVPLSNLLPCYLVHMDAPWKKSTEEYALSMIGKGNYSQLEAVKAQFGKNNDPNAWECAEFVNHIYKLDGIPLDSKDVPSDVVMEAMKKNPLCYLD